ncbi:methyltransferase-like protein 27 [Tachypleus tridentatus]|uniref:methyltransferase-like protein 27 n=1 Tax=Tachypleus tridentatus TaxID=6853 RepID=UPI003FD63D01
MSVTNTKSPCADIDVGKHFVNNLCQNKVYEETSKSYTTVAHVYDKYMASAEHIGAKLTAEAFDNLGLDKESKIVDIGAGTGALGMLLQERGYKNIDAIDGSEGMLQVAKTRNIYRNHLLAIITKERKLAVEDNVYDAAVLCAVFCPGNMGSDAFPELIRIVKPGGIIIWAMRAPHLFSDISEQFRNGKFETDVEELVKKGKWRHFHLPKVIPYFHEHEGTIFTMQVM